ncbi:hypothetical protein ACFLYU_04105 [Candidatus Dependentiae bacterium]
MRKIRRKKLNIYRIIFKILVFVNFIGNYQVIIGNSHMGDTRMGDSQKSLNAPETWLTVFFHGVISIAPVLSFETMGQIRNNKIENTVYEAYVNNARRNNFFNKNQIKQALGLRKIDRTRRDTNDACSVIANVMDLQYSWSTAPTKNHYYTFGWSGLMTSDKRYQSAKKFYNAFSSEIKKFHDKGIYPKTRLIGFSHGGNVCLNIANVLKKEKLTKPFDVDELILLGMPVMDKTNFLVNNPLFKKTYHFYSSSDRVQFLDFSQPGKLFSRKKFRANKKQALTNNLLQVRVEMLRNINLKSGWGLYKELSNKNNTKSKMSRHSSRIRKSSPGHCEWWFLSYTSKHYRDNFALAPLPFVAFIPTIISQMHNTEHTPNKTKIFGNQLTLRIRPFECSMAIKTRYSKKMAQFLSKEKFDLIKKTVDQYPFEKTKIKMCEEQINKEITKAKTRVANYFKKHPKDNRKHRKTS